MKQGENWISGVLMYTNFHAGEKDGGGEGSYCHCKEELLYWRLVVGYPIGDFLNIRKNRNLAGRM